MLSTVDDAILHYAGSGSFIDIGPLWGTVNEKITVAAQAGAKRLAAADIYPTGHYSWSRLRQHCATKGVSGYEEFSINLDEPNVHEALGQFDFVYCSGIIYHAPSPVYTLDRLRSVTGRYLLIQSMVVPETVSNDFGSLSFAGGRVIYIPAMNDETRRIMAAHFESSGLEIMHINAKSSEPFRIYGGLPNYGPWWWLYSPSTLRGMIETSNFKVIADFPNWEGRAHSFLCEII